jgi:hypothetical protein
MAARKRGELPADLLRGRDRFQAWRSRRPTAGSRIPPSLWRLAIRLVQSYGISRTATVLGLNYHRLQKHVEAAARTQPPSSEPAFVELPAPALFGKQCQFELANGTGATMRVQLVGYDAADVEALSRSFWSSH